MPGIRGAAGSQDRYCTAKLHFDFAQNRGALFGVVHRSVSQQPPDLVHVGAWRRKCTPVHRHTELESLCS